MTASEMLCFVHIFGVLIGDQIDPKDEFWNLYQLLKQITDIVLSKSLPRTKSSELNVLIKEHNALYIKLCGDLFPKGHFLVHYGMVFEESGPFCNYWCMRLEAYHRFLKRYCDVITSSVNMLHSLVLKNLLHLCYIYLTEKFDSSIIVGPKTKVDVHSFIYNAVYSQYFQLPEKSDVELYETTWIDVKGITYKPKLVLMVGVDDTSCPLFAEIHKIILLDQKPFFVCNALENIGYSEHHLAFEIRKTTLPCIYTLDKLLDPFPLYAHCGPTGEYFVILKHAF